MRNPSPSGPSGAGGARRPPRCLTIAGSDSGGGAGIQADLKTFAAFGCYGTSVVAALTSQNTRGVEAVFAPPPGFVASQIDAVLSDIGADSVKTGMLFDVPIVEIVAHHLEKHDAAARLVVDPVMMAASGARLLSEEAIDAVRGCLLPLSLVVTPNLMEAEALVGRSSSNAEEALDLGRAIQDLGPRWVVITGGHSADPDAMDLVLGPGGQVLRLLAPRLETRHTHGTGCGFASALCANLARGMKMPEAAVEAKRWLTRAIEQAFPVGSGHGPVHHFHRFW